MKQLEVQIMGQSYLLGCAAGGESRLLEAVERVDTAMCKIRDGGKVRARDRIAVLAALNLAFDLDDRVISTIATGPAALAAEPTPRGAETVEDKVLSALLDRLDRALGADGQLI